MAVKQTDILFELAKNDQHRKNLTDELLQALVQQEAEPQPVQVVLSPAAARHIITDAITSFVKAGYPRKFAKRLSYLISDVNKLTKVPIGEHPQFRNVEYTAKLKLPGAFGTFSQKGDRHIITLATPPKEDRLLLTLPHELTHSYQASFPESVKVLEEAYTKLPPETRLDMFIDALSSITKSMPRAAQKSLSENVKQALPFAVWSFNRPEMFANMVAQEVYRRLFGGRVPTNAAIRESLKAMQILQQVDPRVGKELDRAIELISTR